MNMNNIKTLRDIHWLHIGTTDEYKEIKKWIALICRDVTHAGCIDEICINDIVVGFDQKGYSVVKKEDLESLGHQITNLTNDRDLLLRVNTDISNGPIDTWDAPEYSQYNLETFIEMATTVLGKLTA